MDDTSGKVDLPYPKAMVQRLDDLADKLDKGWCPTASTTVRQGASELDDAIIRAEAAEEAVKPLLGSLKELYDALEGAISSRGYEGEDCIENYSDALALIGQEEASPDSNVELK